MRKKLSDITNSQLQDQTIHPTQQENALDTCFIDDKACIQQLLKERVALMKLVAEKRHCAKLGSGELKPLENLFEIEDAKYHVIQSRRSYLRGSQDENGNNSTSRNEAPRCSFGIPLRKSVENAKSYKDTNSSKTKSQFAKTRQG
ncbi:hypothetical protein TanjilG_30184 [Lupinus angustifolius]|uniref:Uncharacterized protein n=1 Tax=Lupinus angustifolius TaxID=3871 RepID=A0A4P1R712_LUPAN|nr:hypothetical protein TanjilG_30184 [Lupinus angustifolius]